MNKYLVLSDNKYNIIDAENIKDAKKFLTKSLNKKDKVYQLINLTNAEQKFFISK